MKTETESAYRASHFFDSSEELNECIDDAERQAYSDFEIEFVERIKENFDKYGLSMYFSSKQNDLLLRIANW